MKFSITSTIVLFLFAPFFLFSQEKEEFEEAIEDNSFFIEEAYNQEVRVVQHIFNLNSMTKDPKDVFFTFTQEWPAFGQDHQLSYVIPYQSLKSTDASGIGDILLNYRYQLVNESRISIAPRFSFILPTGDDKKGLGMGSMGVQICFPLSYRISNPLVTHFNAGTTIYPSIETMILDTKTFQYTTEKKMLPSYFIGESLIWLMNPNYNLMLEYVHMENGAFKTDGTVGYNSNNLISLGLRFAINLKAQNLQIVPGIALVFTDANSTKMDLNGLFFYLSFEHGY